MRYEEDDDVFFLFSAEDYPPHLSRFNHQKVTIIEVKPGGGKAKVKFNTNNSEVKGALKGGSDVTYDVYTADLTCCPPQSRV